MDAESLIEHIGRLPHGQAGYKQLVRELGTRGEERRELDQLLERLVERGRLIETRSGHYMLADRQSEYVTGRISLHRDGYGFVIPDQGPGGATSVRQQDIYVDAGSAAGAMHGDRVLVRLRGPSDGRLVRVLARAHAEVVGEFHYSRRGSHVVPYDEKIRENILIARGAELPPETGAGARHSADRLGDVKRLEVAAAEELDGAVVNVEITDYPTLAERARGRVIEVLGRPGDFGIDVEIMIRKHHLPHRFPPEVIEEAESLETVIRAEEMERRRDFRRLDVVTIDGETARDFDDAVWVERTPEGHYQLQVHIADVSHYVREGTALDREARLRGTSVYFPDRAVPMLPYELSTGVCSLNPRADRLVLSVLLELDPHGDFVAADFCEGVIRSAERMTYTDVNLVLESDAGLRERYARVSPRFETMAELARILNRRRHKRGSIDFDLPEPVIEFDEAGMVAGIARAERNIAHRLIEEFMLAANEAVASLLEKRLAASLYRIHEKPDPRRVMEFEQVAAGFGYSLGVGRVPARDFGFTVRHRDHTKGRRSLILPEGDVPITSQHYQRLIARLAGKPEERILSYLMLRSLKQARYSEENRGHFALASPCYTHFTSPIRRYPDLVAHRLLKTALGRGTPSGGLSELPPGQAAGRHGARSRAMTGAAGSTAASVLRAIAEECSFTERRAADAERELLEWKKARFLEERLGDEFDAIVVSVTKHGLFVELLDLFIEGLVPIETLAGDRYTFRQSLRAIVGERRKRKFALGDRLTVRVDRVDAAERRVLFSWVPEKP
ncbi:MAG TPA: VacB/RNase II family 3'-5' exoribonuclease [Bryobacterales bacterium]|nr:VacB/RNase II family 3'-5' exoribonuclease [Bryobacterales bacterium]